MFEPVLCGGVQKFAMQPHIPVETASRIYRRYLKLEPTHTEEYIAYLKAKVRFAAAWVHAQLYHPRRPGVCRAVAFQEGLT